MSTPETPAAPVADYVMSEEQKFSFDMRGWLLIPGVLSAAECQEIREFLATWRERRESLPRHERAGYGGPVAKLHDHPVAAGILRSIIAQDVNEKAYGFRLEGNYIQYRQAGSDGIDPHGGGAGAGPLAYQVYNRRIYSGLTRVVWEINPVEKGAGGTLLMSGSHKSAFGVPPEHRVKSSPLFETYDCPEGSLLFFTESLCHSGALWKSATPRLAVFNCYSDHHTQYHKQRWDAEVVASWPAKRQTLVRGVWHADFNQSPTLINDWYGPDNRAY